MVDLGDQTLRNIPRAVRAYKVVPHSEVSGLMPAAGRRKPATPVIWAILGSAVLGCLVIAAILWRWQFGAPPITGAPFDAAKIPLVTDRARETLASYAKDFDYKALAISREGYGVVHGAPSVESAKQEAIERCNKRDQKGYCRIYAIGNVVVWDKDQFPLPADIRAMPFDVPFTPEEI